MTPNLVKEVFGNAKPADKKASILNKVRALLAQADDEMNRNPALADNLRSKGDQFMTMYAIEQWEVDTANEKSGANRPKPEVRYFDFHWFYRSAFRSELWSIFLAVADNCRCVIAHRGQGTGGTSFYEIPVIGIASDLDWFDLLFTSVMLQMGNQLEPKPDASKSFGENAYTLRAAGMARPRIAKLLYDADLIPGLQGAGGYYENDERLQYERLAPNKEKSLRAKVRVAGEKWGSANGHDPTTTVNPKVWQRSFAEGYRQEINRRLRLMAAMRKQAPDTSGSHMEIVLRDIYQMALDLYEEMWPRPEPVKIEHGQDQKRRRVAMAKEVKMSGRAIAAGQAAAAKANLTGSPQRGVGGNKKELGS